MPSAVDYLLSAQSINGGWGYRTGHSPVVEPTAAVLLALREQEAASQAYQRGLAWLLSSQHPDGGWGINENDPESGWQTAWAIMALKSAVNSTQAISKAAGWLATEASYDISAEEFRKPQIPQTSIVGALVWPWLPGQATWIEPTALAILALNGLENPPLAEARMKSALNYFDYYRTASGGWNVGNSGPLDTHDLPRAFPTALVLLALASFSPKMIQAADITALQQDMQDDSGILAQAVGTLALHVLGKLDDLSLSTLSSQQLPDGSWEHNPFATALAMLALWGSL